MALPFKEAFTARAIGFRWNSYQQTLGIAPYLGRSYFATQKIPGLELKWIKGRKGLPVSLTASNYDALPTLREPIGFSEMESEMPFFREAYLVKEKDIQMYNSYLSSAESEYAQQILANTMLQPMDLIMGADVVPERMIWQLLTPPDGSPKISIHSNNVRYDYDYDKSGKYKTDHFIELKGNDMWSNPATATPIADLTQAQEQQESVTGEKLTTFQMNQKTWKQLVGADDTRKQVQGAIAYQQGMMLKDSEVKEFLLSNYGITILVYNKLYIGEDKAQHTFIPDGIISAISDGVATLGTVNYGVTPHERVGSILLGNLSIVNTGVVVYTYTEGEPIVRENCLVEEIVLPSYENMDSTFVLKVS